MKKKLGIGLGILVLVIVAILVARPLLFPKEEEIEIGEDPYGIEYYTVPNMEQVFVNGIVKPEQSQEFSKEEELGTVGELQVENGESVEKGRLFYTYENKEITTQLSDLKNQVSRMETQKSNAEYKLNLAIKNWNNQAQEERVQTLEEIKIDMSTSDIDAEIKELYDNIKTLKEEQFKEIVAPFDGKVYIPEVKDADSAILKLISDKFYVSGTVNEKDVSKLAVEQIADIKVVSNDQTVTGKVNFIDLNPSEGDIDGMVYSEEASTMSNYPVKLSLDTLEGIRNGYHVQAVINIGEEAITIPTVSIHEEEGQFYVLVNDFGTLTRRVIQIGEEEGENTVVTSGLEAEDQIVVSSKEPVEEGQVLSDTLDFDGGNLDGEVMEEGPIDEESMENPEDIDETEEKE